MLILKIGSWNPSEFTVKEILQLAIGMIELALLEPQTQIKGGVFIVDLSGLSLDMAWYMTPTLAKHILNLAVYSFPIRTEEVHVLHTSWIFDMAWSMLKPLITETIKEKIYFHGDDLESFHGHIDPKCLPKRYGGVYEDYPLSVWFENVLLKDEKIIKVFEKEGYNQIRLLKEEEDAKKEGDS
nr:alpha-tocopherol transfer protein-like [Leptinotarsa decemlineata]